METKEFSAEQNTNSVQDNNSNIINEQEITSSNQNHEDDVEEHELDESIVKNYSTYGKKEIVEEMKLLLSQGKIEKKNADVLKVCFYKIHRAELEEKRQHFIEEGGIPEDFKPAVDELEIEFKKALNQYRNIRTAAIQEQEKIKAENLEKKLAIIDKIKKLSDGVESTQNSYNDFKSLQHDWQKIGLVPQSDAKNLYELYQHAVEKFYDFLKINNELRELDFKRNLEAKIEICERAETLILEPNIVEAYKTLQDLHDNWHNTGPVDREKKDEVWNRFKDATSKINKRHQDYFLTKKEEMATNLKMKTELCEKIEEIAQQRNETVKDWQKKSDEIIEIQKLWKTIGPTLNKQNQEIYIRFRKACDTFFSLKRDFFNENKTKLQANLQLKLDLCSQAEALKDGTDFDHITRELINLQKEWKKIGPIPKSMSDKVWFRFRGACDEFFNKKTENNAHREQEQVVNLQKKKELIAEMENYKSVGDSLKDLENIQAFQRQFSEIGFVPMASKNEVQDKYRAIVNSLFDTLKIDQGKLEKIKFKAKVSEMADDAQSNQKMKLEREKLTKRQKQLHEEINVLENNIGFFGKSKNADKMIASFVHKLEELKGEIQMIQEKINILNQSGVK